MNRRSHIIYLSFDGLLEPLGYAQVARVVMALADEKKHRFTICSLEKPGDLDEQGRVDELAEELRCHQVRWHRARWSDRGGVFDVAKNVRSMTEMVEAVVESDGADLLHARSYVAATVARRVGEHHGVDYLFDTRGFWVDERLERGLWFDGPLRKRAARVWESRLFEDASGAVTLTEAAAREIRQGSLGSWKAQRPLRVIPTCVDYGEFGLGGPGDAGGDSEALCAKLRASLVVGYIGAVNRGYRVEASLRLFDHVLARRPDAHLLCLTGDPPALLSHLKEQRFPPSTYTVRRVEHRQMPRWLPLVDWGLLLRRAPQKGRSHLGAMPTKLGEFFASGVRPVYGGPSPEVRHWIEKARSGHLLEGFDETELRRAAEVIATTPRCLHTLWGARWRTRSHFGLENAVQSYHETYEEIAKRSEKARMRVLFLTEGTTVPASRFRVEQLVPHLEARGIDCTVRPAYGDGYNRWAPTAAGGLYKLACSLQRFPYLWDADRFDLIFLQRPALPFSAAAERLANWRNQNTIFDVDDAIFAGDGDSARRREVFETIVEACAHVICGNEYIAERTRHITATTVIPTVIDTDVYRPTKRRRSGPIVVGWMGTAANFDSLKKVEDVLGTIGADVEGAKVQIVSNQVFEPLQGAPGVEQVAWSAEREVELLRGFDVGIMPLVDNAVTRGKCGFKAIQYMAMAIPVVASPVGVNEEILAGGKAGVLAGGAEDFEVALRELIGDDKRRRRLGRQGRRIVEERYSVDAVIDRYVKLFEAVARRDRQPLMKMERAVGF